MKSMALFDDLAGDYDSWYQGEVGAFVDQIEADLAFSLVDVQAGMSVLDAGCGTGNYSIRLAQAGAQVQAIDISSQMLKEAKRKAETLDLPIAFQKMDMNHLDFPRETFDLIFSMTAIEFIADLEAFIASCFDLLKPGGYLLIGSITESGDWGQYYQEKKDSIYNYAHFRDTQDFIKHYPKQFLGYREGLYLPVHPDVDLDLASQEANYAKSASPSFTCVLWQKAGEK
ncbi:MULTISPECIES: class I SAM-dependent methyltransferase [Aerococcus]|uniref:class I SAM-dependent methyltransferase n=1 Tax=Aerococcus urinae (strain CCUG 59500 / ACS-120-V-Col10a) TaxID=2976812 RepID=UPI0028F45C98|nr:methyltransferase domain-containing protein [Aerococcus sp. Group 1]